MGTVTFDVLWGNTIIEGFACQECWRQRRRNHRSSQSLLCFPTRFACLRRVLRARYTQFSFHLWRRCACRVPCLNYRHDVWLNPQKIISNAPRGGVCVCGRGRRRRRSEGGREGGEACHSSLIMLKLCHPSIKNFWLLIGFKRKQFFQGRYLCFMSKSVASSFWVVFFHFLWKLRVPNLKTWKLKTKHKTVFRLSLRENQKIKKKSWTYKNLVFLFSVFRRKEKNSKRKGPKTKTVNKETHSLKLWAKKVKKQQKWKNYKLRFENWVCCRWGPLWLVLSS